MKLKLLCTQAIAFATVGCTLTPEMAKTTDTGRLCKLYASPGENFMNAAIRNELIARQATYCLTPQYIQQQAASRAMNMMMFGYGMQMMQNNQP